MTLTLVQVVVIRVGGICGRHDIAVLASVTAATVAVLSHNLNVASTNKTDHHHHHHRRRRRRRRHHRSSIIIKRRILSRQTRPEVGVVVTVVVVHKMMLKLNVK